MDQLSLVKSPFEQFSIDEEMGGKPLDRNCYEEIAIKLRHDVASFLNFRVMSTGELEVRVRYAGFGKDEDEWVNVKGGVRQASTPLEPSECHKVKDGDIVLCFKESDDYALYCDACVLKITRQEHDPVECNCIFTVQYEYDNSEADVYGKDICCRPSEEKSVALALPMQSIESLWG
ncbi:hypothetical protein TanjilG_00140 [Lupinus angustifolius]|uniref:SAWADEE domain-containing protein n=1 Tax=Lupinus angustifolius TaxID=3871 RepID=A0A394D1E5_LUPAN|nr:hypothetical protein TanjilG_00140 [Lupinus angustifolius]